MVCNEGAREVHVTASALTGLRIEKYGLRYRDIEELLRLEERGMLREWLLHKLTRMGPEGVQEIKND